MTEPSARHVTSTGIAYDYLGGPVGAPTLLFLHAGVCDRRMWDGQFAALPPRAAAIRVDLRGFGASHTDTDGLARPLDAKNAAERRAFKAGVAAFALWALASEWVTDLND